MAYLDKFTRGERKLSKEDLKDYSETIRCVSSNVDDTKILNLYRDCFGPHVTNYFGAPKDRIEISHQADRIVAADNLTHVFLNLFYVTPDIISANSRKEDNQKFSLPEFSSRITTNPIDACNESNFDLGTNKITYLVGDVGVGKSTLISRLVMDLVESKEDIDGFRLVPIVYDFEIRHKEGEKLKNIDESFWADLYSRIYQSISGNTELAKIGELDLIAINPINASGGYHRELIHHIRQLIHHLALRKIRLFLIFDNLDRYHFHFTKVSFFEKYAGEQFESVKNNISVLINMFDKKDLWASGLCVLFACRRYLYEYLSNFDDVTPKDNHFGVFQLPITSAKSVVTSRMNLFEAAVKVVDGAISATKSEEFHSYLEHLKGVMVLESTAKRLRQRESPALSALVKIGHNGHRSLVKFLTSLPLRYKDSDVIKRLLVDHTHLLLLLYIANNHQRFSQDQSHFPNIFLNDCVVSPNKDFPDAHKPHEHTYWLKYLILKYLNYREQEQDYCTGEDIIEFFSGDGRYEPYLVRLALGSLCSTAEYSCIEIEYNSTSSISDCRLTLTGRGKYLVGHDKRLFGRDTKIDFSFNFLYLQLVVDDKLLAIPKLWYKNIFSNFRYGYLYYPDSKYGETSVRIILQKLESTLYFLRILETDLKYQSIKKEGLFKELGGKNILPDFKTINSKMLVSTKRLLRALNQVSRYEYFETLADALQNDTSFDKFFVDIFNNECLVRK